MANLEIKQLFNYSRFSENEAKFFLSILYIPLGVILLVLRGILAICLVVLGQVLPDSPNAQKLLRKLASLSFGISVTVENPKKRENVDAFISNNLSVFDQLAVHSAVGSISPSTKTPIQNLPGLGTTEFGSMTDTENFKKNLATLASRKGISIHMLPEDRPTNGKALLKFNTKPFKFFNKVQPLCIQVERPFLDISLSTVDSTYANDVTYFMYSPFTNYKLKFLPSVERNGLSDEDFAAEVRQKIAEELKIEASPFTPADLAEWDKKRKAEERRRAMTGTPSGGRGPNPELARMATQVKEVLPHVPVNVIYNDLTMTRSVDTTITNVLEGRVRFIAEPTPSTSSSASKASSSIATPSTSSAHSTTSTAHSSSSHSPMMNTAASSFGRTAGERAKSFQERKEQMIAEARRRYIEKHNLNLPI